MIEDVYPLSPLQEGIYFHWLQAPESPVYFEQLSYTFKGQFDILKFRESYQLLVSRHAILRTFFTHELADETLQVVRKEVEASTNYIDASTEPDFSIKAFRELDRNEAFDLNKVSQTRLTLVKLNSDTYELIWSYHHILMDGWCIRLLIKEFFQIYFSLIAGKTPQLKKVYPYSNYIKWLGNIDQLKSIDYWKTYLADYEGLSTLPKKTPAIPAGKSAFKSVQGQIDPELRTSLKALCSRLEITENIFFQTVWAFLLKIYSGTNDTLFGSVVSGRPAEVTGIEEMLGLFINTIPVRIKFAEGITFEELAKAVSGGFIAGLNHHYTQLAQLQEKRPGVKGLFDHIMVFENYPAQEMARQTADSERNLSFLSSNIFEQTNYNLTIVIHPEKVITLKFIYNTESYSTEFMEGLHQRFMQLVRVIVSAPGVPLTQQDYLSAAERLQLLETFNDTNAVYPVADTAISLFEKQVLLNPARPAVFSGGLELSYEELNRQANRLTAYLTDVHGIGPGDLAGICLERSEELVISILAVLKTGAAYVPVDPAYPVERINYMQQDSGCKIMIDPAFLVEYTDSSANYSDENPGIHARADDLAYVIYTSGSTGQPKGVMIEHSSLVNLCYWHQQMFSVTSADRGSLYAGVAFDASAWELFPYLLFGAAVVVVPDEIRLDTGLLNDYYHQQKITISFLPSQIGEAFYEEDNHSLRYLLLGGDRVNSYQPKTYQVVNNYGPTENSVVSTSYFIDEASPLIPIGKPVSNTRIYILGDGDGLVPVGVTGELCISGVGLARGYLNKEALTKEKFVPNPYLEGELMYRSGDLARWRADGNIEFIGRKDDQVKVRGYRIELGEVEHVLGGHPAVSSVVVLAPLNDSGERFLVAYLVGSAALDIPALKAYLSGLLPGYMVPAYFMQLDSLPLTLNGKIDKKALPAVDHDGAERGNVYQAAENETQAGLISIWTEILGVNPIGINDDFFELGGHSLKATRLSSQIHKVFNVKIGLKELFANPVLRDQALLIHGGEHDAFESLLPVAQAESYVLSSSQRRLWVLSQFAEGNVAYNMPGVFYFEGDLDENAFEQSFAALISRHEILRTTFREDASGEVRQYVHTSGQSGFVLERKDVRELSEAELQTAVLAKLRAAFDLERGPLLRAGLYRIGETKWVFSYAMHHIISDGWSMGVLIAELSAFYNAFLNGRENPYQPLRIQYKDYASWQQSELQGGSLALHKAYWLDQFSGELPVLELPTDRMRPAVKTYNGAVLNSRLSAELTDGLNKLCRDQGCTLFMGLLSVVNTLLYRYSGQQDIVIGSPVAGREHTDLEGQIGFYINTLALRSRFSGSDRFTELLAQVRELTLAAYEHQAYPFDELVDALNLQRDLSRSALFDVMVTVHNTANAKNTKRETLQSLKVSGYQAEQKPASKFDLSFDFVESTTGINMSIEYNTDIYSKATIARMELHFQQLITVILSTPEQALDQIDYLSTSERLQLLDTFHANRAGYPAGETVIGLFEKQVLLHQDKTAVQFEDRKLSYAALNQQANRLSAYLMDIYEIGRADLAGICLERSEQLIVVVLAVLKAGAAYVPLDPGYPEERIAYMKENSSCKVIIDASFLSAYLQDTTSYSIENPQLKAQPDDLAYVIYTSGSTGQPKGVMVEQHSLISVCKSLNEAYRFKEFEIKLLQLASISFDVFFGDICRTILSGGEMIICSDELKFDFKGLFEFIQQHQISVFESTPGLILPFLQYLKTEGLEMTHMKLIIFGSDALNIAAYRDLQVHFHPKVRIVNSYGTTETCIDSTYYENSEDLTDQLNGSTPIGRPLSNTEIYIVDKVGNLVPMGVTGEICIGGDGLARGYLNLPEMTAMKFKPNPFKTDGGRIYLTGDLGKWLADGNIEFMGRKDNQVKIRGFRIELAEIENALHAHDEVQSAVVLVRLNAAAEKELVAYIIGAADLTADAIRAFLSDKLPHYMVPSYVVLLSEFPLTPNKKIDKKALLEINVLTGTGNYVKPGTETEEKLVRIWSKILGMETGDVGIKDNFFHVGGNSLKSISVISKIHEEFNVRIDLKSFFQNPFIESMARYIDTVNFIQYAPEVKSDNEMYI
ncbi:amino acid adenylation domain-containing protein [Pedobacter sp. AW31-3R]|uniref:amino acid adenylation domain-containing protein n=1 Tax=Pedobacter sp. AW31-3R TaxID=3445781 RepID=UPI003F9FEAC9